MIGNLQILRAFAASGVVIYHSKAYIFGVHTEFYGVALFFVLSGYLMCKICNRSALNFAMSRFWRIVPSYWLAMVLMLQCLHMWTYWPIEHTLLSFLFIPHNSPAGLEPVLGVGWTLNLEVYFYTIFTFAILVNKKYAPVISGVVIFAISYGLPLITQNKVVLYYYAHDYVKFFVYGIGIWYTTEWLKATKLNFNLPIGLFPLAIFIYTIEIVFFGAGLISVPILFLVTILAANHGADIKNKVLLLLGDASYGCYLLHTILLEALRHKGIDTTGSFIFTSGVLIGSWALAIVWHLYVEKYIALLSKQSVSNIISKFNSKNSTKLDIPL